MSVWSPRLPNHSLGQANQTPATSTAAAAPKAVLTCVRHGISRLWLPAEVAPSQYRIDPGRASPLCGLHYRITSARASKSAERSKSSTLLTPEYPAHFDVGKVSSNASALISSAEAMTTRAGDFIEIIGWLAAVGDASGTERTLRRAVQSGPGKGAWWTYRSGS